MNVTEPLNAFCNLIFRSHPLEFCPCQLKVGHDTVEYFEPNCSCRIWFLYLPVTYIGNIMAYIA